MAEICINKSLPAFNQLAEETGMNAFILAAKISVYQKEHGENAWPTAKELVGSGVNYMLKAVQALSTSKAAQVFGKGAKNGWALEKILTELQIPKAQQEILLSYNSMDRQELLTNLLADYSYVIEIDFAKHGYAYDATEPDYRADGSIIHMGEPASYYESMTVPGGTNYTENEIFTPAIEPSIKGHAQFSTKNGIGWFRSDDKVKEYTGPKVSDGAGGLVQPSIADTTTRRILEIQSDLFQKGRDKKNLITSLEDKTGYGANQGTAQEYRNTIDSNENNFLQLLNKDNNWVTFFVKSIIQDSAKRGYEKVLFPSGNTAAKVEGHEVLEDYIRHREERLQEIDKLLSAIQQETGPIVNSYGITMDQFVDAGVNNGRNNAQIIQDVKKHFIQADGEWMHFNYDYGNNWTPEFRGDSNPYVAATSTEEFYEYVNNNNINLRELVSAKTESLLREKEQFERELGEAQDGTMRFSSIASFYENTINNVLEKNGYTPTRITDEYGNSWNEVNLTPKALEPIYFNKTETAETFETRLINDLTNKGLINSKQFTWGDNKYWVVKRSAPGSFNKANGKYVPVFRENMDKLEAYRQQMKDKYGWYFFDLVPLNNKTVSIRVNKQGVIFNKEGASGDAVGQKVALDIAQKLSDRLGIPYTIISREEAESLINKATKFDYDSKIMAFYYDGKVYIIEDSITAGNVMHEFTHPFVRALQKENPKLYDSLYEGIINSTAPGIQEMVEFVKDHYPVSQIIEETIVRGFEIMGKDQLSLEKDKSLKSLVDRFLLYIKQLLRRLFNITKPAKDLSTLTLNTSLGDLVDMLYNSDEVFDMKQKAVGKELFPIYNKKMAEEFKQVDNAEIVKMIAHQRQVLKDHIYLLRHYQNYSELRKVLSTSEEGNLMNRADNLLRLAQEFEGDLDKNFLKLQNFAQAILNIQDVSKRMKSHIDDVASAKDIDERDKLKILHNYLRVVTDWEEVFEGLRKANGSKDLPLIGDAINRTTNNFKLIHDYTDKVFKQGVTKVLKEQLDPIREYGEETFRDKITELQAEYDKGNKAVKERLDSYKKWYELTKFDEEKIVKYLEGEMGDTNRFSSLLESYTSSPDPVVGGFAAFLNKVLYGVEAWTQGFKTDFTAEADPLYKALGVRRSNPAQLGQLITTVDKIPTKGQDGKLTAFEVRTLTNPFHNGWLFDYRKFEEELEELKEAQDWDKYSIRKKEFEDFKAKYFNREYVQKIYDAKNYWNTNPITEEAYKRRKKIIDQLRSYEDYAEVDDEVLADKEFLEKQLKNLASTKNLDGSTKSDEDTQIAKAIQDYYKMNRELYQEFEIKGAFNLAMDQYKIGLEAEGIPEGSPEHQARVNAWIKENIRVNLTPAFYNERQRILDEITQIISKLQRDQQKELDISKYWEDIIDQTKGFRDPNGYPIGSEMEADKVKHIQAMQVKIEESKQALTKLSGLNNEEQERLNNYFDMFRAGMMLNVSEQNDYDELIHKKSTLGLNDAEKARLQGLYAQLRDLSGKMPTDYYIDAFNSIAAQTDFPLNASYQNSEIILDAAYIDPMLEQNAEFSKWFKANHIRTTIWNNDLRRNQDLYVRLYIWNRILPNEPDLRKAFELGNYEAILAHKSPYVEIKKASKYYFYRIKDEYKTGYDPSTDKVKLDVGTHVDNRGNWLPLSKEQGQTNTQYLNPEYYRLKESSDKRDKDLFKLIQVFQKYLLKGQENGSRKDRLWMEVPRMRKEKLELANQTIADPKGAWQNLMSWARNAISPHTEVDDFQRGNAARPDDSKTYVMTDIFGNQTTSIPVRYMAKMELDLASYDIGRAITRYASSVQTARALRDINPIARALTSILEKNGVRDVNKTSLRNLHGSLMNIGVKHPENIRLSTILNMIERDMEGVENKMELGMFGHRVANHIMGMAAFGSLALNIPAGIKNMFTARIQNVLESVTGKSFSGKIYAQASSQFFTTWMPRLVADYNKLANKSLETQLFELFDPVQGRFMESLGKEFTDAYARDAASMHFFTSPQRLGEVNAQGTAAIAMLMNQMVEQEQPDGTKKMIPYLEAWQMSPDKKLTLKPGISQEWAPGGNKFSQFKLKMAKINELLQGAYAKANQPEAQRYTTLRMMMFMRKYFVPGFINRFAKNRPNIALGYLREGYYRTFLRVTKEMLKSKMKNWHLLSEEEKRGFWRTLTEIGYSLTFLGLLALLGYDDGDKNRFKKLKSNSWAENMLIYELLLIKGETETFIPIPGMGVNELLRIKDSPSIAFPLINKYYKLLVHMGDLVKQPLTDDDLIHYDKSTGIYEKGDLKLMADFFRILGYSGGTTHPATAIKAYSQSMNRYK